MRVTLSAAATCLAALIACEDKPADKPTSPSTPRVATVAAESSAAPWMAREPDSRDRQAYFEFLEEVMPETLAAVTCECCGKSLGQCYGEMGNPAIERKCPFT